MARILPGATLGILGGGQLGRMTAMAARSLGLPCTRSTPTRAAPIRFVVERCITAAFDDVAAAEDLARGTATWSPWRSSRVSLAASPPRDVRPVRPGRRRPRR
jgi:5-(carboxyamino)imidazole ribonucleotide synthase